MFARLTSSTSPYTWTTAFPAPGGGWTDGTLTGGDAYESNGNPAPEDTIVDLTQTMHGEYRFTYYPRPAGDPGPSYEPETITRPLPPIPGRRR